MSDTILTSECVKCQYGTINDENKARVKVYCGYKEKEYWFGSYIPCDNFTKKRREE